MHWAFQYIGKPWVQGAVGPDSFDCWGLVCFVYKKHYDIELVYPAIDITNHRVVSRAMHEGTINWQRTEVPFDGCAVLLGTNKQFHHVGIYLDVDGGLILHCNQGVGTVAQSVSSLRQRGMGNMVFFQHGSHRRNTEPV